MKRRWSVRKIAFVSILIATSVSFVLIFSSVIPIASLPSFKLTLAGLPIKLTGYIFGPMIGAITGVVTDLISFIFRPTFIHWSYTLAFMFAGLIPGMIGYVFNRTWKNNKENEELFSKKYLMSTTIVTLIMLFSIVAVTTWLVIFKGGDEFFAKQPIVHNKWLFYIASMAGMITMIIGVPLFRIFLKPKQYNIVMPIIAFSILLEIINTPLVSYGDTAVGVFDSKDEFITALTGHLLISPAKIWFNLLIISFAYKVVSPLIYNKTSNGW